MFDNNLIGGAGGGGFYPKEIEQSLRFNDDDSAYLSRTPASAGNQKTWTFSTWVKRGNLGFEAIFTAYTSGGTPSYAWFAFGSDGTLRFDNTTYLGSAFRAETTALFRDTSAWYHIVFTHDTTDATAGDRYKIYVNGIRYSTVTGTATVPALNSDGYVNSINAHGLGRNHNNFGDLYLSEVHFIDGQALDATSFGEFKNGVWVPKNVSVTYGTNGFYLPFRNDYTVEGMSTVTYTGNGSTQYIGGVGFEPDLVWIKSRDGGTKDHNLYDVVRGVDQALFSSGTYAEATVDGLGSFDADGFAVGTYFGVNANTESYVAWCWDAGTGSPVSNTDGSITSTVKANPAYGFSVVSYTGNGANATVGHGLSQAPEMMIIKDRDRVEQWIVYHKDLPTNDDFLYLNLTNSIGTSSLIWNSTAPTSSVFSLGSAGQVNTNTSDCIAYCFHSVSGYSDFGSYTGTGVSGNTVTTGFKPAFVMAKRTDAADNWRMYDSTRSPISPPVLYPNLTNIEAFPGHIEFTDTGFTWLTDNNNASGGTYIYMAFADTREAAFWLDDSGNNNDWENNNLTESDIVLDSPTNNFCTFNPLHQDFTGSILRQGNLEYDCGDTQARTGRGTIYFSSGKVYWETYVTSTNFNDNIAAGIESSDSSKLVYMTRSGTLFGADTGSGTTYAAGDILGQLLDIDNSTFYIYKNGVLASTLTYTPSTTSTAYSIFVADAGSTASGFVTVANFGQDSSFAGNKTPQGYTDANGLGDFYYAPPAGALALCTSNLPEPAIGPNSATTSDEHFNTVLHSGTSAIQSVTGVGFQPDLTWQKQRSGTANSHKIFDIVRGGDGSALYQLASDDTGAEVAGNLTSLDIDGYTLPAGSSGNVSGDTYVAWNWKANGSGVSNSDGSITSTVSANTDAGFSIVGWPTPASGSYTIGHGLNQAPEMIIVKGRNDTNQWLIGHESITWSKYLHFITNATATDTGIRWNNTAPTSNVFTMGSGYTTGGESGANHIAYCFHSVDGFSKFGSYTGNGSTDGPFVYTGFRPAFVMVKRADAAGAWYVWDSARGSVSGGNVLGYQLYPDQSAAESVSATDLDFLSNGFKIRDNYSNINGSGGTYIFACFASNPFKYSNAR